MSSEEIIKLSASEQHDAVVNKQIKAEELLDALYSHIEKENEEIGAFNSLTKEIAYNTAKTVDEKVENKSFDCSYSWSDMANALTDHRIPHEVVRNLADVKMAMILKRPVFDIFKFDDYLHDQYGGYELEGKSMRDMFKKLFGDDADKIAYYFGIEK